MSKKICKQIICDLAPEQNKSTAPTELIAAIVSSNAISQAREDEICAVLAEAQSDFERAHNKLSGIADSLVAEFNW